MTRQDMLLGCLVAVFRGINFTAIQLGLAGVLPLLLVAIRFIAIEGVPSVFIGGGKPSGKITRYYKALSVL